MNADKKEINHKGTKDTKKRRQEIGDRRQNKNSLRVRNVLVFILTPVSCLLSPLLRVFLRVLRAFVVQFDVSLGGRLLLAQAME